MPSSFQEAYEYYLDWEDEQRERGPDYYCVECGNGCDREYFNQELGMCEACVVEEKIAFDKSKELKNA